MPLTTDERIEMAQGATFLTAYAWVEPAQQRLALTGSGAGTFTVTLFSTTTSALTCATATATDVQSAVRAIPTVGTTGVIVTGSGTTATPWLLAFAGPLAGDVVPPISVVTTGAWSAAVTEVPKDLTGWTASFVVAPLKADGTFDTAILTLTETVTANGKVILGYLAPSTEGDAPGTADLTNGMVALWIKPAATATLTPGVYGARHRLLLTKTSTSYIAALIDGAVAVRKEPS